MFRFDSQHDLKLLRAIGDDGVDAESTQSLARRCVVYRPGSDLPSVFARTRATIALQELLRHQAMMGVKVQHTPGLEEW